MNTEETGRFHRKISDQDKPDDFFTIKVGGRTAQVFRRMKDGVRLPNYYLKGYLSGKQVLRSTGVDSKGMAKQAAEKIWRAALEGRWDLLDESRLQGAAVPATVQDLIAAYEKNISSFALTMKERSAAGYVSALKSVVRRVHGDDMSRVPATALNEELVEKFFAAYLKEAPEGDLLARDGRVRGANSTLNQARAMFGEVALKCYRGMKLPDLKRFLKARVMNSPAVEHGEISAGTIWEMAQAALCLRDQCPALYLAHLCYRHLGMRNDEIEHARWGWIEERAETVWLLKGKKPVAREVAAMMVIKRRKEWVPKRGSGEVPIAPDVWAEFKALRPADAKPEDFIVAAPTMSARADLVDRDHNDFVRPWVVEHRKRSYELRRWAATLVAKRQGDEFADRFLRHKSKSTAGKHYLTAHAPIAPITLEDCGLASPAS